MPTVDKVEGDEQRIFTGEIWASLSTGLKAERSWVSDAHLRHGRLSAFVQRISGNWKKPPPGIRSIPAASCASVRASQAKAAQKPMKSRKRTGRRYAPRARCP